MGLHQFSLPATTIASLTLVFTTATVPVFAQPQPQPESGGSEAQECLPQNALIPANVVVISRTASTNTPCYRILIPRSGKVSYVLGQNVSM
jgi:hypothetical protein